MRRAMTLAGIMIGLSAGCNQSTTTTTATSGQSPFGANAPVVVAAPVDQATRQAEYQKQLDQQRASRVNSERERLEKEFGRDKVLYVTVVGVSGNEKDADHYMERKLFRAAYAEYQAGAERAREQTEANRKAAEQQAVSNAGNFPGMVWYNYKRVNSDVPYPRVVGGSVGQGTYHYIVGPITNIDQFNQKFNIGKVNSTDMGKREVQIQSLIPDPIPDIDLEELIIQHGQGSTARLLVTGAQGDPDSVNYYLEQQSVKLDPATPLTSVGPKKLPTGELQMYVAPVGDLQGVADRVGFGKVTGIDQATRTIHVAASLPSDLPKRPSAAELAAERQKQWEADRNKPSDFDTEPRPGEDVYVWAMRVIKAQNAIGAKAAYDRLANMETDPDHLKEIDELLIATFPKAVDGSNLEKHIEAMATWQSDEGRKLVIGEIDHQFPHIREKVIKGLAKFGHKDAAKAIAGRLGDFFDTKHASAALTDMGEVAEDAVIKLLDHRDPAYRAGACSILGEIGGEKSLPKVRALAAKEKNGAAKQTAKEALEMIKERVDEAKGTPDEPAPSKSAPKSTGGSPFKSKEPKEASPFKSKAS